MCENYFLLYVSCVYSNICKCYAGVRYSHDFTSKKPFSRCRLLLHLSFCAKEIVSDKN